MIGVMPMMTRATTKSPTTGTNSRFIKVRYFIYFWHFSPFYKILFQRFFLIWRIWDVIHVCHHEGTLGHFLAASLKSKIYSCLRIFWAVGWSPFFSNPAFSFWRTSNMVLSPPGSMVLLLVLGKKVMSFNSNSNWVFLSTQTYVSTSQESQFWVFYLMTWSPGIIVACLRKVLSFEFFIHVSMSHEMKNSNFRVFYSPPDDMAASTASWTCLQDPG